MGALTTNRKRGDSWFSLSHVFSPLFSKDSDFRPELQTAKKPRISPINLNTQWQLSSPNTVSRICRYPGGVPRLPREVHAPCRNSRFARPASSFRESLPGIGRVNENQESIDEMGNLLVRRYDAAKTTAVGALQHLRKDKAPEIDVEMEFSKDEIPDDSSIEEIEVLDDGREWLSVVSDRTSNETNADVLLQDAHAKLPAYGQQPSFSAVSELTKVDEGGKMMVSLSVSHGAEELGMLPHKKLLESAERRNPKLSYLNSKISFLEKKLLSIALLFPKRQAKRLAEVLPREPFLPLTQEEEAEVSHALSGSNRRRVLVTHENSNIVITGEILQCLSPNAWLNDELISGIHSYDFKAVRRWTTMRKIGYTLIECDKIFVPIHKKAHWVLAVINKKDEKFQYLDSYKGMDPQALEALARYFVDEVKDKSGMDINVSSWKHEYVDELPEQQNGWDCGMFMIKYIDFYSRGLRLCFNEEHMPYFRRRTAKEILRLKAQ
ncbi:ubiquitin-like-specific protease ESD4 isoform X2 [Macadamia integrifolia]|uniref:ubiquitin-like-specific protease ESD4 isoform X2 n=1 Tax=Macadamia integrifolia TaxID=60698 RepID=UPI001C4F62CE|nr:ubiquitin-like-specific protease ESD4 isoform X2 [Macadamia integrifolia]